MTSAVVYRPAKNIFAHKAITEKEGGLEGESKGVLEGEIESHLTDCSLDDYLQNKQPLSGRNK